MSIAELIGVTSLLAGSAFGIIGAVGLLRFPDFFSRIHAAGITDTLCSVLVLGGLALMAGFTLSAAKLLMILFFLLFTTPTATHALAHAALRGGEQPKTSGDVS